MRVLGHRIDGDGSVKTCSNYVMAAMNRAFFGNMRPSLQRASRETKLRFLDSCVCSISKCRWARWPYTRTLADKLDACQRRFLYQLFPTSRHNGESLHEFFPRRHRSASRIAASSGKWSKLWTRDLHRWDAHVKRQHDINAWSHHILSWRGQDWIGLQRLWNSSFGESRTNTRAFRGHVHRRWENGLQHVTP